MGTPIDTITFNILNMAEKFQNFFHGESGDVEFKYINDDGDLVTTVVPNVAKYIAHLDDISVTPNELNTALDSYNNKDEISDLLDGKLGNGSVLDTLTSDDAGSPVSAKQAKVLKGLVDDLAALMTSDDTDLDTLQELVAFVKANKADLAALKVENISGLQDALDTKAAIDDVNDALATKINTSDIVDNLTSTNTDKPVSANQGKILNGFIDTLNDIVSSDDDNLDTVQKITDFVKAVRSDVDGLDISGVSGLQTTLDAKAVASDVNDALDTKINTSDIVDALDNTSGNKPLSANQGKVLKGLIDTINTALTSDDSDLDSLQELVDFIKVNRDDLAALKISSIAGLQDALDAKAVTSDVNDALDNKANSSDVYNKSDMGTYNDFVDALDAANN